MSELEREIVERTRSSEVEVPQIALAPDSVKAVAAVPVQFALSPEKEAEQSEQTTSVEQQHQVDAPIVPSSAIVSSPNETSSPSVQLKSPTGMTSVPPVPLKTAISGVSGFAAPTFQFKSASIEEAMEEDTGQESKIKADPAGAPSNSSTSSNGLPGAIQAKMEGAMGADFSNVNIHKESASATEVGALAYAQGNDVHFAPGQYNPESSAGQELIGHELAHVVQQRQGRVQPTTQAKGLPVNDDKGLEAEADAMGQKAAQMKVGQGNANSDTSNTTMMNPSSSTIQRWEWPWSGGGGSDDKDKGKDDKTVLKTVKLAGSNKGTNFDTKVSIPGSLPAVGDMNIQLKIAVTFMDCTIDNIKSKAVFDQDNLKTYEKQIKAIEKTDASKLKWSDKEKEKFKTDYQESITYVWSSDASKLTFKLDDKEYEKYQVKNRVELIFTDKDAHEKINTIKMLPEMTRLRSYRGSEDLFDSRDVSEKEKRTQVTSHLAEQIGEFESGKAALTPSVTAKIDQFVGRAKKIMKDHSADTPTPSWSLSVRGRASSGGSAAFNKKLSVSRATIVSDEIFSKMPDLGAGNSRGTGATNTEADSAYQRVEAVLVDTNLKDVYQNVAAHETGHMFGLGDEYSDETTSGALKKSTGDEADGTSKAIRDAGMGEDEVNEHRVNQHNDSIMNSGSVVSKGHYAFFLLKLKEISTDVTSGQQVNWQVSKG